MGGKSELVRSSVRVGAVQGQTADNKEETKDPSAAVLLKSKIEGEDIDNIVKWNDNQIVYSHDDDDHRHTLDRISGVHGGVECRTSYGAVF